MFLFVRRGGFASRRGHVARRPVHGLARLRGVAASTLISRSVRPLLPLCVHRPLHTSAVAHDWLDTRAITKMPRGMSRFQTSSLAPAAQLSAAVGDQHFQDDHWERSLPETAEAELPPWPVDAIEFNIFALHGGHDARRAWDEVLRNPCDPPRQPFAPDNVSLPMPRTSTVLVPKVLHLTPSLVRRLREEEETAEGQAALHSGGWVCTGCWSAVNGSDGATGKDSTPLTSVAQTSFPRRVCPVCRTLRHDAESSALSAPLRNRSDMWWCRECGEVNACTEKACRCCGTASNHHHHGHDSGDVGSAASSTVFVERQSIFDEIDTQPLGHIVVTRHRTTRWRCGGCKEVNSLQMSVCRNCSRERFDVTVSCPICAAPRHLSNAIVFDTGGRGDEVADVAEVASSTLSLPPPPPSPLRLVHPSENDTCPSGEAVCAGGTAARIGTACVFDRSHCFHANSVQLNCLQCHSPLHGGALVNATASVPRWWWCACGVTNSAVAYSCCRCRLPRSVGCLDTLLLLLRGRPADDAATPAAAAATPSWDFRSCTNWMCDNCDGVNRASYRTIAEMGSPLSLGDVLSPSRKRQRRLRRHHGDGECRHCGAPWHHQLLQGGACWRCACHTVNSKVSALCTSCGLPALDNIGVDVLSSWTRGDWYCPSCGAQCYRERQRCSCGTLRPPQSLSRELD